MCNTCSPVCADSQKIGSQRKSLLTDDVANLTFLHQDLEAGRSRTKLGRQFLDTALQYALHAPALIGNELILRVASE